MPDFEEHVRRGLGHLGLPQDREAEMVEEIAEHMRAAFQEALEGGATEEEALTYAESPFVPWDALRRNIEGAVRMAGGGSQAESVGRLIHLEDPHIRQADIRLAIHRKVLIPFYLSVSYKVDSIVPLHELKL